MRRRTFVLGLYSAAAFAAAAQPSAMPVIGFLNSASRDAWAPYLAAFRAGLEADGYVEGRNVEIEFRWAEAQYDRLPALATDLVRRKVSVLVATGGVASVRAAIAATQTIPIVFTVGGDPVTSGLVASLARPTANATGISLISRDLTPKRLELLRELVPTATVIALLLNPENPASAELPAVEAAIRAAGQELRVVEAKTDAEIERAFERFGQRRPDALLVAADPFFEIQRAQLAVLAARYAIPAVYGWREYVDAGGLMSYGSSLTDGYRRAGDYTGKVLNGTKPSDLPVQEPTRFELVVNQVTARAIGVVVPASLLARADEVIE